MEFASMKQELNDSGRSSPSSRPETMTCSNGLNKKSGMKLQDRLMEVKLRKQDEERRRLQQIRLNIQRKEDRWQQQLEQRKKKNVVVNSREADRRAAVIQRRKQQEEEIRKRLEDLKQRQAERLEKIAAQKNAVNEKRPSRQTNGRCPSKDQKSDYHSKSRNQGNMLAHFMLPTVSTRAHCRFALSADRCPRSSRASNASRSRAQSTARTPLPAHIQQTIDRLAVPKHRCPSKADQSSSSTSQVSTVRCQRNHTIPTANGRNLENVFTRLQNRSKPKATIRKAVSQKSVAHPQPNSCPLSASMIVSSENVSSSSITNVPTDQEVELYKQKLEERRRAAKQRMEEERREQEEKLRLEEEARRKEEEEIIRLQNEARIAEELRLAQAIEEQKRIEEEKRLKEEQERRLKEEADKKAAEEAKRAELERIAKIAREEEERQERRKKLDEIMKAARNNHTSDTVTFTKPIHIDEPSLQKQSFSSNVVQRLLSQSRTPLFHSEGPVVSSSKE